MVEESIGMREADPEDIDVGDPALNAFLKQRDAAFVKPQTAEHSETEDQDEKQKPPVIQFKLQQPLHMDKLPQGYFYMGGAARNAILWEFGEPVDNPRDLDIVGIDDFYPDKTRQQELSAQYMAEDYKYGYGVKVTSLHNHMTDTDFTINGVLTDGEYVYATPAALQDLKDKVLRPTEFNEYGEVPPKLVLKALRLFLDYKDKYRTARIEDIPLWHFKERTNVRLFDIALHIDKAAKASSHSFEELASVLVQIGIVKRAESSRYPTATELVLQLRQELPNFRFDAQLINELLLEGENTVSKT